MDSDDKAKDGSLIRVAKERGLVARSASLAKRGLESLQTLDRIARFPAVVSIGDAYLFDRDLDVVEWLEYFNPFNRGDHYLGVENIENVIGNLRVPNGKYLALGVTVESKLPLLSALASDSLNGLVLGGTVLNEEDFYIDHLKGLKYLALLWGSGTDASLSHLSDLKSLTHLFFYRSKEVIDLGLSYISNLKSLTHLRLQAMTVTVTGFSYLSNLTSLSYLDLSRSNVTDSGLSFLSNLTQLSHLNLLDTHVTNDGLSYISNLTSLLTLSLYGSKITDEGLSHLYNLTSLTKLDLRLTGVSEAGIQRLQSSLPDCQISS